MLNLNPKPELKEGLASISSHVTFGRLTPHLQSVRPSIEGGDLLSQGASNAFQPSCCQEPYPIEQYYPTAILNFYRYLLTRSATPIKGIRTVFINNQYSLEGFKVLDSKEKYDFCLSSKSENTKAKGEIPPKPKGARFSFHLLNPTL